MIPIIPATRGRDKQGAGYFGASRDGGSRRHNGVDFVATPGDSWRSLSVGVVTKIGYPYSHDLSFRYVQVTDDHDIDVRYFYVDPEVHEGQSINVGDILGTVQRLPYEGITQHVHVECRRHGKYYEPHRYLAGDVR